jgi:phospholipid/cholesterol/gamma-HCH transport system substrate-binding protein
METKAHYVLIGAFTLLMIAAGFGLVLFFSGTGSISPRKTLEVIFNGSVAGLSRGASVTFNGLRVGEVTSMRFVASDPSRVAAFVQIDNAAPVRSDAKARLEASGLTGTAVIALSGGAPDAPPLVGNDGAPPVLIGEPSQLQNLLGHVEDLSAKADALISKADKLISDNGDTLTDTMKNIDAFSKALGANASGVQGALASIAELSRRAAPLADRLAKLTDDADRTLNALDSAKINGIVDDVSKFTGALSQSQSDVKTLIGDTASFAKRVNDASAGLQATVAQVSDLVAAVDKQKVAAFVDGAGALGDAIHDNKDNIDHLIKNAADVSAKIDEALADVKGTLASVDGLVKAVDQEKLTTFMDGAAALGGALRDNRDNISTVIKNAADFSGRLNDAVANVKGTLANIDAVVQAVDRQKIGSFLDGADALGGALRDNRGNIDNLIKNASELSAKLNDSADKIDGVLVSAQSFLGSSDVKGPFAQIGDAAKSVRQLADDVDHSTKELSVGLVRFSSSGLKEYEALAVDGRRTLNDLDHLLRSLDNNPTQLLFGKKAENQLKQ